jgi:hypothetical protein
MITRAGESRVAEIVWETTNRRLQMDKDIASLLTLPWATLLVLASGYAGYYVANAGLRDHHKAVDIAFSTIVFGFLASFPYHGLLSVGFSMVWASLAAFATSLLCGAIWNRRGRGLFERFLRISRVSHTDSLPTALASLFAKTGTNGRQLTLKLTDGTWLHCEDLSRFAGLPNGPCSFGLSGDVLMYATHVKVGSDDFEVIEGTIDEEWGAEIVYIPRDKIERFYLRRSGRLITF